MPDTAHTPGLDKVIHAHSHTVLKLNTKRFDKSPYFDKWVTDDTIFGIYNTRLYPVSFGEDTISDYWQLRKGIMLYDVPEMPISVKGADAVKLLERALTRKIGNMGVWKARYAIACTPQGGIIMDGVVLRLAEDHFWYVQANGGFEHWLNLMSDGMDVEVGDPQSRVLQVQGPKALEFLERACPGQKPERWGYFNAGRFNFNGMEAVVSRTGFTGEMGIEIYGNPENDPHKFWDYIFEVGEEFGLRMGAGASMTLRRVEAGILDYDMDINPGTTPFDAGLESLVEFDNPDFVEVVIHSYRHRFGGIPGDPDVAWIEEKLARQPDIPSPAIVLQGADDGVDPPQEEDYARRHFTGPYERRVIAGAGHNPPQEAPAAFAQAVLDVLGGPGG